MASSPPPYSSSPEAPPSRQPPAGCPDWAADVNAVKKCIKCTAEKPLWEFVSKNASRAEVKACLDCRNSECKLRPASAAASSARVRAATPANLAPRRDTNLGRQAPYPYRRILPRPLQFTYTHPTSMVPPPSIPVLPSIPASGGLDASTPVRYQHAATQTVSRQDSPRGAETNKFEHQ